MRLPSEIHVRIIEIRSNKRKRYLNDHKFVIYCPDEAFVCFKYDMPGSNGIVVFVSIQGNGDYSTKSLLKINKVINFLSHTHKSHF